MMGDRVAAWWSDVLAGHQDQAHPVYGRDVKVKLDGDRMVVRGEVSSKDDLHELESELEGLRGRGIKAFTLKVRVAPDTEDDEGVLEQTLVGVFDSVEKAQFAVELLKEHAGVRPKRLALVDRRTGKRKLDELIPAEYADEIQAVRKGNHVLVVLTVDEVDAFSAREVLEEETRIITSIALPPQRSA